MPFCPLCQEVLEVRWDEVADTETGDSFRILTCSLCGLGVTDPIPLDIDRHYGPSYHGGRHGRATAVCDRRRLNILKAAESPGRRLLDVGCGDGTFLVRAQDNGWQVHGVEKYPEQASKTGICIYETIHQAKATGPYDCVTFWHVLEHIDSPHEILDAIASMLAPSGVIVLAVPDFNSWIARCFGAHWLHLDVPRHLFHYGETSLQKLLLQHRMKSRRLRQSEFEYDWMGLAQSALHQCGDTQNTLFRRLTGRPISGPVWSRWFYSVLGLTVGAIGIVPVWICNRFGRGGTLIMVARC